MQSSDISSAKYIDEDNSENLSQPETVHSDPEPQTAKTKTHSRFSTAIRKLSGSTKKKKKIKELPTTENVLSSGAEDTTLSGGEESAKKSKNKLSQRFKIGSLGKSKRSVDDEVAGKSIEISKTREVTSEHEHTIKTPELAELSPSTSLPGSPRRSERIQKVQITISGKKIEHTKIDKKQRSITTTTTQITGGTRSETDYLIPSTAADTASSTAAEFLEKEKIIASEQAITKPTISTSERLVIIKQSKYDKETPTSSEQTAPPKPSRASELPASKTTSARTAATLKLPTITKKLKGKTASGTKSVKGKGNTQKAEANLMQNTAGTPQRGHRLPKPEKPKTETTIELQLQSHASQSTTNTATTTSGPPSYSPPPPPTPHPIVAANPTKETLSAEAAQAIRYTSSLLIEPKTTTKTTTTTTTVALAPLANISEAIVTVSNSSATDDKVSSAESVLPKDYVEQPRVQFAVGSAVSAQPKLVSLDIELDNDLEQQLDSVGSNLSSDSATPLSDSSRKRIRYIAEPSITEEDLHSLANRRENLVEEQPKYSFDSDYEDYEAAIVDNLQMSAFGDLTMDQEMEPTIMTSANAEKREHLYKILVIGELGTGKTSFIKRYVHQFFSQNYRATIGVDFALKVLHWDANTIVRLQLWDIAGQERFGNMTRVYYKEAVGAFIVFDVTRSGTFDCVSKWKEDLDSKVQLPDGSPIPCILLANKCDQDKQGIVTSPEKMEEYCKENGFSGWYETSAKENINIDEAARALVNKILLNDKLINAADLADNERFNLNNTGDQMSTEPKSKCSC